MTTESWDSWLALSRAHLPPRAFLSLLERFGSVEAVMEAGPDELAQVRGVGGTAVQQVMRARELDLSNDKRLLEKLNVELVCIFDPNYPPGLRNIYDPPPLLYARGALKPEDETAIAIVGSRSASAYGKAMAQKLARGLAERSITVVSGLAVGIDSAAHEGALEGNGRTIGFMACGVDVPYPRASVPLMQRMVKQGALISEFPLGTQVKGWHFHGRNRLISGFSLGTVVVEAPEKSGALITADHALDQGKHVFAVPGSIASATTKGTHSLLREGATLVEEVEDILEPLGLATAAHRAPRETPRPTPVTLDEHEERILRTLARGQRFIDQVIEETGLLSSQVSASLMLLEMKGLVRRLPGGSFIRA